MGGKGGGGETTSTVHQSNLPEYARPYYESLMGRAQDESTRPYQAYPGQRIADQSAQTTTGLNMAQNYAQSGTPDLANARSLSEMVGQQAMDLQNYQAGGVNNTYTGPQDWQAGSYDGASYEPNTNFRADQVGFGGDIERLGAEKFGAAQRDEYTSPYMEAVIDTAQSDATNKAMEEQAYLKAQAGTTGGFGGSRAAMQNQMAMNDAQRRISDIGVQGRQSAFENAQQQFERDQQRSMAAASGNQNAALQMALANQSKGLEAQGMGEASRQFGAQFGEGSRQFGAQLGEQSRQFGYEAGEQGRQKASELGMQAQTATEQLRQSGKDLGLRGLGLAGDTATQLAGFQGLQDQMTMDRYKAMLGIGQAQEDRSQKSLDMGYQDFMNQVNFPRQNLQFFSSLLHGVPISADQNVSTTTPSNPIAGGIGTLMGMQAMQRLGGMGGGTTTTTTG